MSKKQDILDAATRLFSQKGFKEAPMVEISKMTGAAEGTIFYHFKTKEELFISVLETLKQDILVAAVTSGKFCSKVGASIAGVFALSLVP